MFSSMSNNSTKFIHILIYLGSLLVALHEELRLDAF
jgi:hypothetical protein